MLHIQPIQPHTAPPTIRSVYEEIRSLLKIDTVPLMFQYMANYEHYLLFMWDRMKTNIQSHSFQLECEEIGKFSTKTITEIYHPSASLTTFIKQLHPSEQQEISETVKKLMHINSILFLLTLDLREGMKSIFIGTQRITQYASTRGEDFTQFMQEEMGISTQSTNNKNVIEATKMLAPLFGTNALIVSHYPDFFSYIATEIKQLKNTTQYLEKRVEMEHLGLKSLSTFVQPLGCSYQEFIALVDSKPYITELIYLLTDTFPSQFPHLLLTTSLMQYALHMKDRSLSL